MAYEQDPTTGGAREVNPIENKREWRNYARKLAQNKSKYHVLEIRTQEKIIEGVVERLHSLNNLKEISEKNQDRLAQLTSGFIDNELAEIGDHSLPTGIQSSLYDKSKSMLKTIAGEDYDKITPANRNVFIREIYAQALERKVDSENLLAFMENGLVKGYVSYLPPEVKDSQLDLTPVSRRPSGLGRIVLTGAISLGLATLAGLGIHTLLTKYKTNKSQNSAVAESTSPQKNVEQPKYATQERVEKVEKDQDELREDYARSTGSLFQGMSGVDSRVTQTNERLNQTNTQLAKTNTKVNALEKEVKKVAKVADGNEEMVLDNDYRLMQLEKKDNKPTEKTTKPENPLFNPEDEKDPHQALLEEIEGESPITKPTTKKPKSNKPQEIIVYENVPEKQGLWSVSPYWVTRVDNDSDSIGPFNGAGVMVSREDIRGSRLGLYGRLEFDRASDTQTTDISRAELSSTGITTGAGLKLKLVKSRLFDAEFYTGVLLRYEKNKGNIQVLNAQRDIEDTEVMGGWELGVNLKVKPNKNLFFFGGPGAETVRDDLKPVFRLGGGVQW